MVNFWAEVYNFFDVVFFFGLVVTSLLIYFMVDGKIKKNLKWLLLGLPSSAVITYLISLGVKLLLKISRPCIGQVYCPTDYSFPSDHASVIFSIAVFLILYKKDLRYSIPLALIAVVIGISGFMTGVHTIMDVIGGSILGSIISYVLYINREKILRLTNFI